MKYKSRFIEVPFLHLHGSLTAVHLELLPLQLFLRDLLLLWLGSSSSLGKSLLLLKEDNLDVAGRGHVRVDATVGTVHSSPHLGSSVDQNVVDNQVIGIKTLKFSIGLCVLQQVEEELGRLLWPTTLIGSEDFGLSMSANASIEPAERNDLLLGNDVLQVGDSPVEVHLFDGLSSLTGVLQTTKK